MKTKTRRAKPAAKHATKKRVKRSISPVDSVAKKLKLPSALVAAFEQFKTGRERASEVAARLNLPRGKVRKAFKQLAGGREGYAKIMAQFAPVLPPRNGGPRVATSAPDDKGVRVIKSAKERKRWDARMHFPSQHARPYEVYIDPDGVQYVEAHPLQKADVIVHCGTPGLQPIRMRKLSEREQVAALKAKEKEQEAQAHREAKAKAKRKAKREKRARRKGQLKR